MQHSEREELGRIRDHLDTYLAELRTTVSSIDEWSQNPQEGPLTSREFASVARMIKELQDRSEECRLLHDERDTLRRELADLEQQLQSQQKRDEDSLTTIHSLKQKIRNLAASESFRIGNTLVNIAKSPLALYQRLRKSPPSPK